jgi:hypothetical protein
LFLFRGWEPDGASEIALLAERELVPVRAERRVLRDVASSWGVSIVSPISTAVS